MSIKIARVVVVTHPILVNGNTVRALPNGDVEVTKPNGSIITAHRYILGDDRGNVAYVAKAA